MRTQYRCGVCGVVKHDWPAMRSHVAYHMPSNEQGPQSHPHWRELDVSHADGSAWKEEVPGVMDY